MSEFIFDARFFRIRDKICKAESDISEYSMTDGLLANFAKIDYVRGMSQALYKLGVITRADMKFLRDESQRYAEFHRLKEMENWT